MQFAHDKMSCELVSTCFTTSHMQTTSRMTSSASWIFISRTAGVTVEPMQRKFRSIRTLYVMPLEKLNLGTFIINVSTKNSYLQHINLNILDFAVYVKFTFNITKYINSYNPFIYFLNFTEYFVIYKTKMFV